MRNGAVGFTTRTLRANLLGVDDAAELQALLERCAEYFRAADGRAPAKHASMELISDVEGDDQLTLHGFAPLDSESKSLLGLIELRFDEPGPDDATVVLLLLEPSSRGRGFGGEIARAVIARLKSEGIAAVHLGVQDHEVRAEQFWQGLGFVSNGRASGVTRYVLRLDEGDASDA